jgi:hypothetical protein
MRFRALAVALMFPLGLLAACGGGDDGGLTTRDNSSDTTDEASSETTADDSSDTTEETTEETDATEDTTEETTEETDAPDDTTEETTEDTEETTDETFDTTDITNPDGTLTDEVRDSAIEGLTASGLTEEQAGCMIDKMVELLGVDTLIDIGLAGGGGDAALDALTPEQTTQLVEAVLACDIDPTQLG